MIPGAWMKREYKNGFMFPTDFKSMSSFQSSPPDSSPDFTGWKLEDARTALAADGVSWDSVAIIETAAPERRGPAHTFGEWRVLHCRELQQKAPERHLELVVVRELLAEAHRAP